MPTNTQYVYCAIEEVAGTGIWIRDLRKKTEYSQVELKKELKRLLAGGLVRQVVLSSSGSRRKSYVLSRYRHVEGEVPPTPVRAKKQSFKGAGAGRDETEESERLARLRPRVLDAMLALATPVDAGTLFKCLQADAVDGVLFYAGGEGEGTMDIVERPHRTAASMPSSEADVVSVMDLLRVQLAVRSAPLASVGVDFSQHFTPAGVEDAHGGAAEVARRKHRQQAMDWARAAIAEALDDEVPEFHFASAEMPRVPAPHNAHTMLPCAECRVASECMPEGDVSPERCVYMAAWMEANNW